MVNMLFFLRFKSQLSRTRPDIVRQIDETLNRAVEDAGGNIIAERPVFMAAFNEDTPGFWLEMFILFDNLKKTIETSRELYGYALVLGRNLSEATEPLCRFLSTEGGIFLDNGTAKGLLPYAEIVQPSEWLKEKKVHKYGSGCLTKVKELKSFAQAPTNDTGLQDDFVRVLEENKGRNTLIQGPDLTSLRSGLHKYCGKINKDFPALSICFGSDGLGPLADAWSGRIRALADDSSTDEIDSLWELLFRERIRDEISPFVIRSVRRFFFLLVSFYTNAAVKNNSIPVLALENLHLAGSREAGILIELLAGVNKSGLLIIGTCEKNTAVKMHKWKRIFQNTAVIGGEIQIPFNVPPIPIDLWEIMYAVSLFGRYFSPELFQRLFEEEKINPVMTAKAFSLLCTLQVIDNPREPWPLSGYYTEQAQRMPEENANRVKAIVRKRLLNWAGKRNLNPCFRLLSIIAELDGVHLIDDTLILRSLSSDIINKTTGGFESAVQKEQLESLVTEKKTAVVRSIFETSKVLHSGNEEDIRAAFKLPPPVCDAFPVLKAQVLVNLCAYHLGMRDTGAALKNAKDAILMGQGKNNLCLPQAYRLFSIVCLSKHKAGETIEYLDFALKSAEKTKNYHEMGITSYYAAAVHFLCGDIFKAAQFTRKSIEQSLTAGRPQWADRARFLEGRLEFEIGRYGKAQEIFETLQGDPFDQMTDDKSTLLAAWIYRSKVYGKNPLTAKPEKTCCDTLLFEIEAACIAGDYKKAAALSKSTANSFSKENFLYTEQPDWSSGFAQCEYLYFSRGEIYDRMVYTFHSLALSRLSAKDGKKAIDIMERILRDEQVSEMDPWDAFYFFTWYRILEHTGANPVEVNKAISMAFRRLQRRASRIGDIETRRQYLNNPRWNRELGIAAKEFKLI